MGIELDCNVDQRALDKIMRNIAELAQREVVIGLDDTDHSPNDELSMQELGVIMEHGTKNKDGTYHIPPRRFFSQAGYLLAENIEKESRAVVINTVKSKHALVDKNMDMIGVKGVDAVQGAIEMQKFRKLSPTTIRIKKAKGSRTPTTMLVDSGALFESATYKIK